MPSWTHRSCVTAVLTVLLFAGCSQQQGRDPAPGRTQAGPTPAASASPGWTIRTVTISPMVTHVHGIVANADGSLLAGTHAGLYHIDSDGKAMLIGSTRHDLMGLVRADDGTLLASGHPEPGSTLEEPLGLIASSDDGRTWRPRALQGQADFHSLTARGERMAGLSSEMVMTSNDAGRSWTSRGPSASWTLSLDTRTIWATGEKGLMRSDDDGNTFTPVAGAPQLALATAANDHTPWGLDLNGVVWVRSGSAWEQVDAVGSAEAIAALDARTAYVLQGGSLVILHRADAG